jgi:hypothetical protein
MSPNVGRRGESCGVSANEYSCAHGAQINFGNLTPYLTCAYKLLYTYCKCRAGHRQRKKCATVDTDNQQPTPDNQHPSTATVDDSYIRQSTVNTRQPTADNQLQSTILPTNKTSTRQPRVNNRQEVRQTWKPQPLLRSQPTVLCHTTVVKYCSCHRLGADNNRPIMPLHFFHLSSELNLITNSRQFHFYLLIDNW